MNVSNDQNLPPMKFSVEQEVSLRFNSTGPVLSGVIKVQTLVALSNMMLILMTFTLSITTPSINM